MERDRRLWIHLLLASVCFVYLGFAGYYAMHVGFVMDEFDSFRRLGLLLDQVPYRDYQPYKTLAGQALQAPMLYFFGRSWEAMVALRLFHVGLIAGALYWTGLKLSRNTSPWFVAVGLLALTLHSTFLERSAAVRLDMLTGLFGLMALLSGLEGKHRVAALWAGSSFFISQKGGLYIAAFGAAEFSTIFFDRSRNNLKRLGECFLYGLLPCVAYIAVCSLFSNPLRVLDTTFLARTRELGEVNEVYESLGKVFWPQTVQRSTTFYVLAVLATLGAPLLAAKNRTPSKPSLYLSAFVGTLSILYLTYPQPWPYFIAALIPFLAVSLIKGLDQLRSLAPRLAWGLLGLLGLTSLEGHRTRLPIHLARNVHQQKEVASLVRQLLSKDQHYLAGVALVPSRTHSPGFEWMDARQLHSLKNQDQQVLQRLNEEPPDALLWNYRLKFFPERSRTWLEEHYVAIGGSIRVPGTRLQAKELKFTAVLTGTYVFLGEAGTSLQLDGRSLPSGTTVELPAGDHSLSAEGPGVFVRVRNEALLEKAFQIPNRPLFPEVYR